MDLWESTDPYEYFMGRWSRIVAKDFLEWLTPETNKKWLDVGCGSGVLSDLISTGYKPTFLTAIDQSSKFIEAMQRRLKKKMDCRVGDALNLPLGNSSVDITVSGLVLNFIPEQDTALAEMKRVTSPGGIVAAYVWDYSEKMDFLMTFWDTVVKLKPDVSDLHEAHRFPDCSAEGLMRLFERAGFNKIETVAIEIETKFLNFDDYWEPFLGGQGPAPSYLQSLDEEGRCAVKHLLNDSLPVQADGTIHLQARAWAIKGQS